jgi:hypothetical protein
MEEQERPLTEKESLDLIARMINKARDSYNNTGISAMMWGIVIAVCSIVRLSEIQFGFQLPFDIYWLTFVAVIPQVIISIREKKQRRVKTYDDAYVQYVWFAFGISIFLMIFIINVIFNVIEPSTAGSGQVNAVPGNRFNFYDYISSLFLLLYGIPTFITGAACRFRAMLFGGLFCWACSIVALFTTIRIDLMLTALSALVAWFIPGIIMQQDYRKAKKELAVSNV